MENKYLPIGSVVMLTGGRKELLITGYCMETPQKPGKVFDYCGCMYPEGVIRSDITCVFDHSQIEKVLFLGYMNEKSHLFLDMLNKRAEAKNNEQKVENTPTDTRILMPKENEIERL